MRKSIPMFDFHRLGSGISAAAPAHMEHMTANTFYGWRPNRHRGKGELLSFLRYDEIYRSDVALTRILRLRPSAASRWSAPGGNATGCGFDAAPFPSSAMSLGLGIPWQVALQQSLPPLPHPRPLCNDKDSSVDQVSADGTCRSESVSQNAPQSKVECDCSVDLRQLQ